jgi:exopolyphosphatase/guanosine-5'-triphosphate,3'-diphosphate pyrophosphatase
MQSLPHSLERPANSRQPREAILARARRYDFEEGHSLQDERLALRLFDETAALGLHDLADADIQSLRDFGSLSEVSPRDILSFAALLHDIGYAMGYEEHHKTAFKLIMAEPLPGLSPRGQAVVAHVARYHRGSLPDPARHAAFAALSPEDQALVAQLAAILRFADGLDRSHTNAVADLRCELDGDRLIVTLLPGVGDEMERWAGQKKARFFESVFGLKVVLKSPSLAQSRHLC